MASNTITLDVSGRKFRTSKAVLAVSPYFDSLLTRWEDCADLQPDGSYYVDADPDTFEHLLGFMRRPAKFPLYWTKKDGFDYALYSRLEVEADYFMLEGLRDWIKGKKYANAIKTTRTSKTCNTVTDSTWTEHGDITTESLVIETGGDKFLCSSGMHTTGGSHCYGNDYCRNGMVKSGLQRLGSTKQLVTVVTRTEVDGQVLVNTDI
ncbi:hypothetical protein EJ02DRAFT_452460 [Clathrospora elynae]|uniref:BTB domain-containing protein n=1 Tax=Clathrospora elynae TaxID=706981 RepID=A0A6A5SXA5_9PLEO|nr:hypothetical protein EJ02DRAFT_452460 [Clathrospora elynae]